MMRGKVVLAYSGGLDTSVAIRWLQERALDVVALTIDVGQPGNLSEIKEKAQRLGAKAHVVDARREFAEQFVLCTTALAPDLTVIAPAREWGMTREQEISYAKERGIPVPVANGSPYSTDENLWGRSIECGVLEDPRIEPPEEVYAWTASPAAAPDDPGAVTIHFESGRPTALQGTSMAIVDLIASLNDLAGGHGVGRIDHVESRVVGIKS